MWYKWLHGYTEEPIHSLIWYKYKTERLCYEFHGEKKGVLGFRQLNICQWQKSGGCIDKSALDSHQLFWNNTSVGYIRNEHVKQGGKGVTSSTWKFFEVQVKYEWSKGELWVHYEWTTSEVGVTYEWSTIEAYTPEFSLFPPWCEGICHCLWL
jgi:hypothetical protein